MPPSAAIAVNQMALSTKLPKGATALWKEFNGKFQNCTLTASELAQQIHSGHAYTSWHEPNYRTSVNWQKSQFIAVDIDTEDQRSTFKTVLSNTLVRAYGTIIHTTPSHTPDKPRCRVIFFLDKPIDDPLGYSEATRFLGRFICGDRAAVDPSRGFFGSLNCALEEIGGRFPLDVLRHLYQRYVKTLPKEKPKPAMLPETREELYGKIDQALGRINPWGVDYNDWFSIIAAVKNELGDGGLPLAVTWAQGGEGEVERMWKYIRRQGGKQAHAGTIMFFAKQAQGVGAD